MRKKIKRREFLKSFLRYSMLAGLTGTGIILVSRGRKNICKNSTCRNCKKYEECNEIKKKVYKKIGKNKIDKDKKDNKSEKKEDNEKKD